MPSVLVVDSEAVTRRVLRLALQRAGLRVHLAVSGIDALRMVEQMKPDAVIADIDQQTCDSEAFTDWLFDEAAPGPGPVICVTSRTSAICRERVGGRDVVLLEKPFSVRRLIQLLAQRMTMGAHEPEIMHDNAAAGSA